MAALVVSPLAAGASPAHRGVLPARTPAAGTVYGGVTTQNFPVVIEVSKNGRKVLNANVGIRLTCTSGGFATVPDYYKGVAVTKKGRFSVSFGPVTQRNSDGTTTDYEGSMSGKFNKARTKVSGTWSFKGTDHDTAGAVTDTCEAANISWTAKQ